MMMRVVGVVRVGCSVVSVYFGSRVIVCDVDLWSILCIKDCFAVDGDEAVERCTIEKYKPYPSHYIYPTSAASGSKTSAVTQPNRFKVQRAGAGTQPPACLPACAGRQCSCKRILRAVPSIDGTRIFLYWDIWAEDQAEWRILGVVLCSHDFLTLRSQPCFLWCFLGRPLELWTLVDRMVDSAVCGARCRSQPVSHWPERCLLASPA